MMVVESHLGHATADRPTGSGVQECAQGIYIYSRYREIVFWLQVMRKLVAGNGLMGDRYLKQPRIRAGQPTCSEIRGAWFGFKV